MTTPARTVRPPCEVCRDKPSPGHGCCPACGLYPDGEAPFDDEDAYLSGQRKPKRKADYATCDACGGRFSPDAERCPSCGDKHKLAYGFDDAPPAPAGVKDGEVAEPPASVEVSYLELSVPFIPQAMIDHLSVPIPEGEAARIVFSVTTNEERERNLRWLREAAGVREELQRVYELVHFHGKASREAQQRAESAEKRLAEAEALHLTAERKGWEDAIASAVATLNEEHKRLLLDATDDVRRYGIARASQIVESMRDSGPAEPPPVETKACPVCSGGLTGPCVTCTSSGRIPTGGAEGGKP